MEWGDDQLRAGIAAGDEAALAEFMRQFQPRARRLVARALSEADCEDVASEILTGAIDSIRLGRFRGDCRLGTFVHAIARNKVSEHLRRRRPQAEELSEDLPSQARPPDAGPLDAELAAAVRGALASLQSKYRRVLYLYYYRELGIAEIAAVLGVPARRVSEWKDYGHEVIRARFGKTLAEFR